ncbi:MAG TPA: hypothetical protein VK207_10075 [Bacteroidales bacterium]|jgi:hypothetical protein|nr:hypothetical protein [Bacteroidales bacterium]
MRLLTAILLALFVAVLPSCKFFGKKERLRAEMQARQDSIRVADSIRRAQERLLALENARLDSLSRAEAERLANETKYNIIVGSFVTPAFARSLADEYTQMGYKVQIIKPGESKFELVAAEGHKSLKTAIQRLAQFQDTVQVESWLYIK